MQASIQGQNFLNGKQDFYLIDPLMKEIFFALDNITTDEICVTIKASEMLVAPRISECFDLL